MRLRRAMYPAIRILALLMALQAVSLQANEKPNVIFILADDMGPGDLGCYGGTIIPTPNLDRLAAEGMRFTQHYAGGTVCGPSRSCLLTGQHMVKGNLTPPIIADQRVFVASKDDHRVVCLDSENGKARWTFLADGKVDSPPSFYKGRLVFGGRDTGDDVMKWPRLDPIKVHAGFWEGGYVGGLCYKRGVFWASPKKFYDMKPPPSFHLYGKNLKSGEVETMLVELPRQAFGQSTRRFGDQGVRDH